LSVFNKIFSSAIFKTLTKYKAIFFIKGFAVFASIKIMKKTVDNFHSFKINEKLTCLISDDISYIYKILKNKKNVSIKERI